MPYRVWTQKLTKKMDIWYKMLEDCNGDKGKAAYKLGFDPCSFDMLGKATISMYYSLPSGLIKKKIMHCIEIGNFIVRNRHD